MGKGPYLPLWPCQGAYHLQAHIFIVYSLAFGVEWDWAILLALFHGYPFGTHHQKGAAWVTTGEVDTTGTRFAVPLFNAVPYAAASGATDAAAPYAAGSARHSLCCCSLCCWISEAPCAAAPCAAGPARHSLCC
eukprot:1158712-Pelagomonas_calceolata.AAC.11